MKSIGLLGGTGWTSTIGYYKRLNELVSERLGGHHSAKIWLKSIDYHDIMKNYGVHHSAIATQLQQELTELFSLKPCCVLIACNSLHKYYDMIQPHLESDVPVMHAIQLVSKHLKAHQKKNVLLLATRFTLEDGFFAKTLENQGIHVTIPTAEQRENMHRIHTELMHNQITEAARQYFSQLIGGHPTLDAVVLGCTEYALIVDAHSTLLPIVDPVELQTTAAVDCALGTNSFL